MHVSLMFLVSIVLSLSCLLWESLACALAQDPQLHFVFTATDCISDALDGRLPYSMSAGEHPAHCRFVDAQRLSDVHLCMSVNHVIVIHTVDTVCQPVLVCSCDWTSQRRIRTMEQTLTENGIIVDTAPVGTWTTAAAWAESLIMFNAFAETTWSVESKTDSTAIIIVQGDAYTYEIK